MTMGTNLIELCNILFLHYLFPLNVGVIAIWLLSLPFPILIWVPLPASTSLTDLIFVTGIVSITPAFALLVFLYSGIKCLIECYINNIPINTYLVHPLGNQFNTLFQRVWLVIGSFLVAILGCSLISTPISLEPQHPAAIYAILLLSIIGFILLILICGAVFESCCPKRYVDHSQNSAQADSNL